MQLSSLSLGVTRPSGIGGGAASFTPASLFSSGEQGLWYDPSDMSTLFQDSAGTTPVTAVEQPVGRMLDKSGRNNHATQSNNTFRPSLSARYNLLVATATLSTQSVTVFTTSYRLYFTGTGTITLSGAATGVYSAGTHTVSCTAGTLTLTVSGSVLTADLRDSNDAAGQPGYQRVTTSTDYDTVGFLPYLRFDTSDDALVTASMTLSGDTVNWWGMRNLSGGQWVTVWKTADATAAYWGVAQQSNTSSPSGAGVGASSTYRINQQALSPVTRGNLWTQTVLKSTVVAVQALTLPTGAYSIGGYASFQLSARLYSFIMRNAATSAQLVSDTENWINTKTAAY